MKINNLFHQDCLIDPLPHFEKTQDTQRLLLIFRFYLLSLEFDHLDQKSFLGNIPSYPEFDREAITRAVVSRMASMSRMLLTIDIATNKPQVQFIPNNSWILDDESIAKIIGDREGPKKEVLPDIVQAAMKRLIK